MRERGGSEGVRIYVFASVYIICSDQLIAAGAPCKHPRLMVNSFTLACLLYPTRHKLITFFNNSKTKRRTKFCQRKNRLRIDSKMCHFTDNRVILNHPVYATRARVLTPHSAGRRRIHMRITTHHIDCTQTYEPTFHTLDNLSIIANIIVANA